jgi:tetratricopeptide (TPR) repeat protein
VPKPRALCTCLLAIILAAAATQASALADLGEALALLQAGNAEQAYQMLAQDEAERSGDPDFDYLLGLAALDSGRPSQAVFALERVLAVDPGHARARAEIGRAYFQLGEIQTARNEFEAVRKQGVPPQVAESMQRYLGAVDQAITANRRQFRAYAELALGYDTNINSGATDRNIAVPAFPGVLLRLNDAGVEEDDGFGAVGAGFSGGYPLIGELDLVGGVNVAKRENFSDDDFETSSLDGNLGLSYTRGLDVFSAALQLETFLVDNDTFRNALGVVGGWNREINVRTRASAFAQVVRLDYPSQDIRDSVRYVGGVGLSHALRFARNPVVYFSLYGGTEDERRSGVGHLGHDLYGVRAGGTLNLAPGLDAYAGVSSEFRNYGGFENFFRRTRDDARFEVRGGLNYRPAAYWTVTPQVTYVNNHSNIVLNDYDRVLVAVTIRREFD